LFGLGYEPVRITYEELAEGTEAVVARVLERLGVRMPDTLGAERPRLSVQADEISEDWVRRVHEHLAALETPAPA
jgi:LPS sulfotransferase NodH